MILLLVQEDKRFEEGEGADPEAQLIAKAIAAFGINNEQKVKADMDPLDEKVCPLASFFRCNTKYMSSR